jgi:outer membrane protein assembly factor BamA
MFRQFSSAVSLVLLAASAWAFDPFVVKDIRVEGIQRIEAGTIFSYLPVKVGETFTDEKATQAIRALFATGFFRDVRIEVENNVLIVVLEERPAIASITFTGMKEFEPEAVKKGMRETSLQEGRVFDRALVDQAEQEIKRQYHHDHDHAARAQPRGHQFCGGRGRRRQDQADQHRRQQGFQRIPAARPVRAAHPGLAHLVHEE